jgi:hypothetical protein
MKPVLLYLLLVGLPIAGVFGIVRLGKKLHAPVSVGGVWKVEFNPRDQDIPPCEGFAVSSQPLILTISQSGPRLALTFSDKNKTDLLGTIKDGLVSAESFHQATAVTGKMSDAKSAIQLQAGIDRQLDSDYLRGVLTVPACPAGGRLSFIASRQRKADQPVRGHRCN